jgi:3-methylfumaryl-CoA hydratase
MNPGKDECMSDVTADYAEWIGRQETTDDDLSPTLALAAAAVLDDTQTGLGAGSTLPPLWHWFYFLPRAPQALLGSRRTSTARWFHATDSLSEADVCRRAHALPSSAADRPAGATFGAHSRYPAEIGPFRQAGLCFGALSLLSGWPLCIEEEQDIVYREPGPAVTRPHILDWPPLPAGACARIVTPDPRLLFRFSALTFNAHRIHYDRPYAIEEEGYPGLVVHGPLTAVLLMELVRQEVARPVQEFSFRGLAPLFDLAPFRIVCTPVNERQCALEAQAPDGATAMRASVELAPV